mgnify:CR=1 FL=1
MAVLFHGVDVLVRQVDAAGKGHLAVNGNDFPVVPVVLHHCQERAEGVEHHALDPQFFHLLRVILGQQKKAAQVIVHQPDFDPLPDFSFQNFQDGVPHNAFLHNEILQKNILLRFFQFFQQVLEFHLPRGKVLCRAARIDREARKALQIPHLGQILRDIRRGLRIAFTRKGHQRRSLFPCAGRLAVELFGGGLHPHHEIESSAKNGKDQNLDDPHKLIRAFLPFRDNGKDLKEAEQRQPPINRGRKPVPFYQDKEQKRDLKEEQQDDKDAPPEQGPEPFLIEEIHGES